VIGFGEAVQTDAKPVVIRTELFGNLNGSQERSCCFVVPPLLEQIHSGGVFLHPLRLLGLERNEKKQKH
jgi:hypothetical protein